MNIAFENKAEFENFDLQIAQAFAEENFNSVKDLQRKRKSVVLSQFADIRFANLKRVALKFLNPDQSRAALLIELNEPCTCWQSGNQQSSFFNLRGYESAAFLNYFNINQTFLLVGTTSFEAMKNLFELIRLRNNFKTKLFQSHECEIRECEDAEVARFNQRKEEFVSLMNKYNSLQLRYSIMALISQGLVSLFNDSLIELMQYALSFDGSHGQESADFASFAIDQMSHELCKQANSSEMVDLIELFLKTQEKSKADFLR